jgi:GT2 family glycosyltransferase
MKNAMMKKQDNRDQVPAAPGAKSPDISVIIVTWNTCDLTCRCLDSVITALDSARVIYEIILVDNASADGTVKSVSANYPVVKIIQNQENLGFAKAVNKGIMSSLGENILLINTDILLPASGIEKLLAELSNNPRAGIAGPSLYTNETCAVLEKSAFEAYPHGWDFIWDVLIGFRLRRLKTMTKKPLVPVYDKMSAKNSAPQDEMPKRKAALSGACLLIKKRVIDDIGYFDENFYFYFEDIDYCKRANQRGWEIWYVASVPVVHFHNASITQRSDKEDLFFSSFCYYLMKQKRYFAVKMIKMIRKMLSRENGGY